MEKLKNTEFIQSIIRLAIGLLTYVYIASGIESGHFNDSRDTLQLFAEFFFGYTFLIIISIYWVPESTPRRYLTLFIDISCTTFSSYLTGGINSVYVLIYLWIYIGYGTRYGKNLLIAAVAFTFIGYNTLLITQNAWSTLTLDAAAFLLLILALPFYLYSLQKRLQDAVKEAEQANRAKTEFLSSMTHQIRTPIGGVVGMIDLLNKTELNPQQKQYLQALSQSSHTLQEIIEDIVDFSRIEEGQISFHQQSFQPRLLINSLVHSLAPLAYEKELELSCFISNNFPCHVYSDAPRLRQLLSNLIRYAIDHSIRDGVYIRAEAGEVNDRGTVPVSIAIHFEQAADENPILLDTPSSEQHLALRVGSQLTRLMGGQFDIEYTEDTKPVLRIYFSWTPDTDKPLLPEQPFKGKHALIFEQNKRNQEIADNYCQQLGMETHAAEAPDNLIAHIIWAEQKQNPFDVIILCESLKTSVAQTLIHRIRMEVNVQIPIIYATYIHGIENTITENMLNVAATMTKPLTLNELEFTLNKVFTPHATLPEHPIEDIPRSILLAEDSEINASIIYTYLTDMGHNVDIATDGNTALYAMHKHHYDLVFMDINMPNMSGLNVTREWRKLEQSEPPLPIIAITARATSDDKRQCFEAGMNDFLTKPVSESHLSDILDRHIHRRLDG